MQYLTLDEIKRQCNIDLDWDGDNEYLEMVGNASEDITAALLDCPLNILEAKYGSIPATVRHAMRIFCDYYYSVFRGSTSEEIGLPEAALQMIKLYRRFN